ncbi:alpha/beta fold hydrolase [Kordia sp. YSTF-M3]|uniref:Alpha/beta fold hydrolase n=1 Tax=Kordia aestuariivivens TaxID=2759037 RepID=A0ABR7QB88_9FLAO|nr:alpha/beta fold hydrolase [Kordia aestuariivivens]MBC8755616.1 alpha/beta fold hydrolase [Kordia aestuariivivens]
MRIKKVTKIVGILWIIAGVIFFIWMYNSFRAQGFDDSIVESNNVLTVNISDDYIVFDPKKPSKGTIFFFPGALVDPLAYAPLCEGLATHNYKTIIVKMPFRMATSGYTKIKEDKLLENDVNHTLIGHSQGGKMAAQFVHENPQTIDHLILLGTTHPRDFDLSDRKLNILKIYGESDGIASKDKIIANKSKLPNHTTYHEIKGGNHSQFGYYGHQLGDNKAGISREAQQRETITKILEFLKLHNQN